jgi:acyl-CoA synthetase (AMP-forming)/AMP-acid ligase II/4-hydroxybenzoate polyprenyltransferase
VNAIHLFKLRALENPDRLAIADIKHGEWTFSELAGLTASIQNLISKYNFDQNDSIVLALAPSPQMYATVSALMGLGIRIIFIEPWLELQKINEVIKSIKPKGFISSGLGKVWGARSKEIREIPMWINLPPIQKDGFKKEFIIKDLAKDHQAFIVFSSGTTGKPKGVVRTHSYLKTMVDIFTELEHENFETPDLAVFPNVALFHLATGRGAIVVPHKWSKKNLNLLLNLCQKYSPETISTGPAFLKMIFDSPLLHSLKNLKRMVIGGALTDCWLMQKAVSEFSATRVLHIYGGSEAEPIAYIEAKEALKKSTDKGFYQVLCLGKPIPQIRYQIIDGILWVSGPNVSNEYIGDQSLNMGVKFRDQNGILWHNMGDRVFEEDGYLWILGRANQERENFELEQRIYSLIGNSNLFIHENEQQKKILIGEIKDQEKEVILKQFPQINLIIKDKIRRDKRHRSRIDRKASLPKLYRGQNMERINKWKTYIKERSPLSALMPLAAMAAISSLAFKREFDWKIFLISIMANTLIFIQLRLADELKDFEKDKVVNPLRPLPRGLLTTHEVRTAMKFIILSILAISLYVGINYHFIGAVLLSISTIFGLLMYHEFFIGKELNKHPMLYAISHQIIVFFIYGWTALSIDPTLLENRLFQGWLLANFGSSFNFEICRKLNPQTHPLAQTYLQFYGPPKTAFFSFIFIGLMLIGSFLGGFGILTFLPLTILAVTLLKWLKDPSIFKKVEAFTALSGLFINLGPSLIWIYQLWI